MPEKRIYRLLELPWLYRLQRGLLAPGGEETVRRLFGSLVAKLPPAQRLLDVGCGPSSRLWPLDVHPIGVDYSPSYMAAYTASGEPGVVASSGELPFPSRAFDGVWSIGVFHHLPDELVHRTVLEMRRVCRPGGYTVMFDAVLPEPAWRRPFAYALRRADRGRHMRREQQLRSLLAVDEGLTVERITYTRNGLEALVVYGVVR